MSYMCEAEYDLIPLKVLPSEAFENKKITAFQLWLVLLRGIQGLKWGEVAARVGVKYEGALWKIYMTARAKLDGEDSDYGLAIRQRFRSPPEPRRSFRKSGTKRTRIQSEAAKARSLRFRRTLPKIVYRVYHDHSQGYNSTDGFCAGLFPDVDSIPSPPTIYDDLYRQQLLNHIRNEENLSPLISVTQRPLRALVLAYEKHKALLHPKIAVINLHNVAQSLEVNSKVKLASTHASSFKIPHRLGSEWLIWGDIPREALIGCFSIETFESSLHAHSDCLRLPKLRACSNTDEVYQELKGSPPTTTKESAMAIGKFARLCTNNIELLEEIAFAFLNSWNFDWTDIDTTAFANEVVSTFQRHPIA